jgi:hypothetical protein
MVTAGEGHGAFFSSCVYHCNIWQGITIGADTSASVFSKWYALDTTDVASNANTCARWLATAVPGFSSEPSSDAEGVGGRVLWNHGFWNQGMAFPCATCCMTHAEINQVHP